MTLTDIIALIGCLTGCCSLILSFSNYLKGRTNLKIKFPDEMPSFYFDKLYNHWHVVTDKQAIIGIRFINKSREPITIYSVETLINDDKYWIYEYGEDTITNDVDDMNSSFFTLPSLKRHGRVLESIQIDMRKQISLPIRLDPYGTKDGFMFYKFFPTNPKSIKIKFIFYTSRGKKKESFEINEHYCKTE